MTVVGGNRTLFFFFFLIKQTVIVRYVLVTYVFDIIPAYIAKFFISQNKNGKLSSLPLLEYPESYWLSNTSLKNTIY